MQFNLLSKLSRKMSFIFSDVQYVLNVYEVNTREKHQIMYSFKKCWKLEIMSLIITFGVTEIPPPKCQLRLFGNNQ